MLLHQACIRVVLFGLALAALAPAQSLDPKLYSEMHWRSVGPPRAGRARALAGVPSQPNVFYIGFDNGGVWRSTDYGSTWAPLFDNQSTGSIGLYQASFVVPSGVPTGNQKVVLTISGQASNSPVMAVK